MHDAFAASATAPRRIAFLGVGTRGSATSIFEYASAAEDILHLPVHVLLVSPKPSNDVSLASGTHRMFARRFGHKFSFLPGGWPPASSIYDDILQQINATDLYIQKSGDNDGVLSRLPTVRNLVHAVFDATHPHGDVYARNSPSVPGGVPIVPHIVRAAAAEGSDLRDELGISRTATVFCRHGSDETFNIRFVHTAILEVAAMRTNNTHFVFVNTPRFCSACPPNIVHLPAISDETHKSRFIRTCDAMIHARTEGETFGLSIAEFAAHNRPVITSNKSHDHGRARMHLDTLGAAGLYYWNLPSLMTLLLTFDRVAAAQRDWRAYSAYDREPVMRIFERVFLHDPHAKKRAAARPVHNATFEWIASGRQCCGMRGPGVNSSLRFRSNKMVIKGLKGPYELPVDCESICVAAGPRCTHFSHSPNWRACVLCEGCLLSVEGRANFYSSWRRIDPVLDSTRRILCRRGDIPPEECDDP